jgi:uncharacterized protein (TIGR03905 family)
LPARQPNLRSEYIIITYKTQGVCATEIRFEVENNIVTDLVFVGGCPGNLSAMTTLIKGMPVGEVIQKLRGTICRNATSCADQLAQALEQHAATTK